MKNISIVKSLFVALLVSSAFVSCDKDFNNMDSAVVEDDMHYGMERMEADVVAYDKRVGSVQSNNLPQNVLGVYTIPGFGKKTANFVTQAELATTNPTLGNNPVIDSVYVYIPYHTTVKGADDAPGNSVYNDIEPFYGTRTATMKLRIYENGYYLRSTDPESAEAQKYYSDERLAIESNVASGQLNNADAWQNNVFNFSKDEIRFTYNGTVKERLAPGLFARLDITHFQDKLFSAANRAKLVNNNLFREHFRGLYFKIEQNGSQEAMTLLKTADAKIVVKYTDGKLTLNGDIDETERVKKTIVINLKGNTVNFFDFEETAGYTNALDNSDENAGDDKLFVLGGAGSMGVVKISDASLVPIKRDNQSSPPKVLINEANLSFYLDDVYLDNISGLPLRVYLYDLDNKRPLYDYYADVSTNTANQKLNKIVYGGLHQEIKNSSGTVVKRRYKIKITNHINNIINKDSTNVALGLVITDNINMVDNASIKNSFTTSGKDVKFTPASNVIATPGVILYGNNTSDDKKLKLEIFYTKPD